MIEQPRAGTLPENTPDPASHDDHVHGPNCQHDHHHAEPIATFRRELPKIGRNDPCHCGSGKKFKKCHGV